MAFGVVGIAGQISVGKTISANYICEKLGWEKLAFADPLKDIFCASFGVDRAFIEKYKRSNEPPPGFTKTIRKSLQDIGNGFRKIQPLIWVNKFKDGLKTIDNFVICDDERYWNECQAINELGINILLWRPNFDNLDQADSESQLRDVILTFRDLYLQTGKDGLIYNMINGTELENNEQLRMFDLFLANDKGVEDLYLKIDYWIDNLIKPKFSKPRDDEYSIFC